MTIARHGGWRGGSEPANGPVGPASLADQGPETRHAYETLLANLDLQNSKRALKTLVVTSSRPEEGKTTVALNLTLTMTLAGRNVLILDADLRRPQVHRLLGLQTRAGVAEIISGVVDAQDAERLVQRKEVDDAGHVLHVVTRGAAAPAGFGATGAARVRDALECLTAKYEMVVLDSPPVLSVSDAVVLAGLVDGMLLVLNTGVVTAKEVSRAKERIEKAGGLLVGVVMNRFREALHGPGFHPYGGYYDGP